MDTKAYIEEHIKSVRARIQVITSLLLARAHKHDASKLEEPELSWWKQMDEEPRFPYGSPEYEEKMKRWAKVFEHHYAHNRHHPEHFENGIKDMNLIDIIEMICDWLGYKKTLSYSEAKKIVETQLLRYGFSEDLAFIIKNTLDYYFSVLGGYDENVDAVYNTPEGQLEELCLSPCREIPKMEEDYEHKIDILA